MNQVNHTGTFTLDFETKTMRDGQLVFVTQTKSFKHRGPHFVDYSPFEFVDIVDIYDKCKKGRFSF